MLHPVKMQKIRLFALKPAADNLIRDLHSMGIMEISVSQRAGDLEEGRPLGSFDEISKQHVRMRGIKNALLQFLPKNYETGAGIDSSAIPDSISSAKGITIDSRLKELQEERAKVENSLSRLREELLLANRISYFENIDFTALETKTTGSVLGTIRREKLADLQEALAKVPGSESAFKMLYLIEGDTVLVLILYKKGYDLDPILNVAGLIRIILPQNLGYPQKYILWLLHEIKSNEKRENEIQSEISSMAAEHYSRVSALESQLSVEADRAEIASHFSSSNLVFIIEGWLKKADVAVLEKSLGKYDGKVQLQEIRASHDEAPPTFLENPTSAANSVQFMTEDFSLPRASEIDPTFIFFVTVPLLYGMIVGDVIYGIMSIFIALFFMKKFANSLLMSSVSKLWLFSSIPAILFGLIFDEWAGMSHLHILEILEKWGVLSLETLGIHEPLYLGLSRLHNVATLLAIMLYVGMIHLAFGFIIGAINEWHHNKKHAIGKLAWIGVELGGYITIGAFVLNAVPADLGPFGGALLGISTILIAWSEGAAGILELPGIAGNVFSYLAIAIVGLVGTILAELINSLFMPLPSQGLMVLVFFPLLFALHMINAFIAMFEAIIQGGRLNVIEFRFKFTQGDGRLFAPFSVSPTERNISR
ncbi:TPA: hypothetical protein HA238_02325 [Candidatus Micrarchaeota archaeon]|nr:hypothetical protein [Candidatus Micrarchaeota archaeon]